MTVIHFYFILQHVLLVLGVHIAANSVRLYVPCLTVLDVTRLTDCHVSVKPATRGKLVHVSSYIEK